MAKPILFSSPMVKSILAGKKTQTRRLNGLEEVNAYHHHWEIFKSYKLAYKIGDYQFGVGATFTPTHFENGTSSTDERLVAKFPYGDIGTLLWVRETFFKSTLNSLFFKADYSEEALEILQRNPDTKMKWKPSIFMPKEATRILLEITNIRIERLHDISNDDAFAEGIDWKIKFPDEAPTAKFYRDYERSENSFAMGILFQAKHSFFSLWKSINGRESYESNPFVWVIEFSICGREKLNLFKTALTEKAQYETQK